MRRILGALSLALLLAVPLAAQDKEDPIGTPACKKVASILINVLPSHIVKQIISHVCG